MKLKPSDRNQVLLQLNGLWSRRVEGIEYVFVMATDGERHLFAIRDAAGVSTTKILDDPRVSHAFLATLISGDYAAYIKRS